MLRLRTFGGLALERDGVPLGGAASQRRRLALLALLAASDRALSRERVVACLWPDRSDDQGRHSLSQLLYAIRRDLGVEVIQGGAEELRFVAGVLVADVVEFRSALAVGDFERAVACYSGPFLDGVRLPEASEFERWADEQRRALAASFGDALDRLAEIVASRGDFAAAVGWRRKRAHLDPLDGAAARALMTALVDAGDLAGALQHATVHAAFLAAELELPPDPEVVALADRLRAGLRPAAEAVPAADPPSSLEVSRADDGVARIAVPREVVRAPDEAPQRRSQDRVRWRLRKSRPALLLGAGLVVALVGLRLARGPSSPAAPRAVVLGSFEGPDSVLSLGMREALRAELSATPGVDLVSEARVREALRLLRHQPDTVLTPALASLVAAREGVPLVVTGSALPLGTGAQLVVDVRNVSTGRTEVTLSEQAARADQVIPAVARLGHRLSHRTWAVEIDTTLQPLPAVTTTSLAALRNYGLALSALGRWDRETAIALLEGALVHDSLFAMAHFLLGDMLWYTDHERHAEEHFTRALGLAARMPPRERLIVQARFEQVVLDRPDLAIQTWRTLETSFPGEPIAYEGITWAYRAVGRFEDAVAAADSAIRLSPRPGTPLFVALKNSMASCRDTAAVRRIVTADSITRPLGEATLAWLRRYRAGDWAEVHTASDRRAEAPHPSSAETAQRIPLLVASGRVSDALALLDGVRAEPWMQYLPKSLLAVGLGEAEWGARRTAVVLGRQALAWIEGADLSPPAYARLAERLAELSARTDDRATLSELRRFLADRDGGRDLPSYRLALLTVDGALAAMRGERRAALHFATAAGQGTFFGRSLSTVYLFEAEARAATGDRVGADSLYRVIADYRLSDPDYETWPIIRAIALRRLSADQEAAAKAVGRVDQELVPPRDRGGARHLGDHGRVRPEVGFLDGGRLEGRAQDALDHDPLSQPKLTPGVVDRHSPADPRPGG